MHSEGLDKTRRAEPSTASILLSSQVEWQADCLQLCIFYFAAKKPLPKRKYLKKQFAPELHDSLKPASPLRAKVVKKESLYLEHPHPQGLSGRLNVSCLLFYHLGAAMAAIFPFLKVLVVVNHLGE